MKTALVCGAGGFIGSHMVNRLKALGYWVRGVDLKYPDFSETQADEFIQFNLIDQYNFQILTYSKEGGTRHFDEIYQFAADMGGAGYVFTGEHDADIMTNSAQINLSILSQLKRMEFKGKIFYSSSACIYPQELQNDYHNSGLKESDAYPANPDSEYGWEKLFSERLYLAYAKNYDIDIRIARFHNIYGPEGTYKGGKEKAPAALCRKVIEAAGGNWMGDGEEDNYANEIEIWGTGHQTRSFLYIEDCIDAVRELMHTYFKEPINIGSEEMVTINHLAELAIGFSGKAVYIKHIQGPTGVMGRNSNNDLIREKLNWTPKYSLKEGLKLTYDWIENEINS